jgi:hypothetical protein
VTLEQNLIGSLAAGCSGATFWRGLPLAPIALQDRCVLTGASCRPQATSVSQPFRFSLSSGRNRCGAKSFSFVPMNETAHAVACGNGAISDEARGGTVNGM